MSHLGNRTTGHRIDGIDLLRGAVIVLMVLDHARDFFSPFPFQPENLSRASASLFLTRWVTHFCAPVFMLVAGVGARLYGARHGRRALARFLWTRGLWLIVLELTWVNLTWGSYSQGWGFVQVLWALGWSMILLSAMIWLPRTALAALSLAFIAGHNLLDGIQASSFEAPGSYILVLLHQQAWLPLVSGFGVMVLYPLLPWPAVMALGYLLGGLYSSDVPAEARHRLLWRLGLVTITAFVVLRAIGFYGDPRPWSADGGGALHSALAFLNTTKYPASLLFLLMSLGPALCALPLCERARGRVAEILVLFGRVPLFFYLLHVPLIHLLAWAYSEWRYGSSEWWLQPLTSWPAAYEPCLLVTYVAWGLVVALLYPLCGAFARHKRRHPGGWLRYF